MRKNLISEISRNYAQALFDNALSYNNIYLYERQLEEIAEIFENSKDLNVVLSNTAITTHNKLEIIDTLFRNKIDINLLNFIKILIEKDRYKEFGSIKQCYTDLINLHDNKKRVEIVSAVELDDNDKSEILKKLSSKLDCNIIPSWKIDENIIAGLIYKVDDYIIDTSVKTKLENLSKVLNR